MYTSKRCNPDPKALAANSRHPDSGQEWRFARAMPLLFSYGTLQQDDVQHSTFGRPLQGSSDNLIGFILAQEPIDDPQVVATSGKAVHPIAKFTGSRHNRVPGMVFEVSDAELRQADHYEVSAYKRIQVTLESGKAAWVYVEA